MHAEPLQHREQRQATQREILHVVHHQQRGHPSPCNSQGAHGRKRQIRGVQTVFTRVAPGHQIEILAPQCECQTPLQREAHASGALRFHSLAGDLHRPFLHIARSRRRLHRAETQQCPHLVEVGEHVAQLGDESCIDVRCDIGNRLLVGIVGIGGIHHNGRPVERACGRGVGSSTHPLPCGGRLHACILEIGAEQPAGLA